jgi:hypothetical protein
MGLVAERKLKICSWKEIRIRRCICPWSLDSQMHCMQATSGGFTSFRPITEAEGTLNPHVPG